MISNIKNRLRQFLISEYDQFLHPSISFVEEHFEQYERVCFADLIPNPPPFTIEKESIVSFMRDSKNEISNLQFNKRSIQDNSWGNNEILFPFINKLFHSRPWGTLEYDQHRHWKNKLEYACKDEFLNARGGQDKISSLLEIEIFDDVRLPAQKIPSPYYGIRFTYIESRWLEFIAGLVTTWFPDYQLNDQFSGKKIRRYLAPLEGGLLFGIEYDELAVLRELRRSYLTLPEPWKIVLINPSAKSSRLAGLLSGNDRQVLDLGILGNPFFYDPCCPMTGFSAVDTSRMENAGRPYAPVFEKLDEQTVKVIFPRGYADSMKTHACFYMDLLASTSKSYLEYLKLAIVKSM